MKKKEKEKHYLYQSHKIIKIFFFLVALIWIVPAGQLFLKNQISSGVKFLVLGIIYMLVVFGIQTYFIKMIMLYQKNLNKVSKKYKNRKVVKNKGGFLK